MSEQLRRAQMEMQKRGQQRAQDTLTRPIYGIGRRRDIDQQVQGMQQGPQPKTKQRGMIEALRAKGRG